MLTAEEFSTSRLPFAIALHASGLLKLIRCERTGPARVEFVFENSENQAAEIELAFDSNSLMVSASQIFASQKFLRRQMSAVLENRKKIGESKHDTSCYQS